MPSMKFEFDAAKSAANKAKHKLEFVAAQALWSDPDAVGGGANSTVEPRWMVIAKLADKLWTAIYTRRGDHIRIISVRPARTR